jgi:ABC-type sugar transport system substrate-binding protein
MVLMTFSLSGCSNNTEVKVTDLSKEVKEFNESITKVGAEDTSANEGLVIGSVNMGMNGEWFSEVLNGINDAADDQGVTVKMFDSENDINKEREGIQKLLDEGMDALVISPLDSTGSVEMIKKVKEKGIPVVIWNTTLNYEVDTAVGVNSNALGADTGKYVCEYIKANRIDNVKMIIIDNRNYDVGIARCEGSRSSIRDLRDEGLIDVVAEAPAETFDASVETTGKLIKAHPETTMIWAWNQPSLLGAIEAVKQAKRNDIMIMGTDMSMELAKDMLDEDLNVCAITTQLPYNMGYKSVINAVKAIKGEDPEKTVIIPVETYTKDDKELVERYLDAHKDLVEYKAEYGKIISK